MRKLLALLLALCLCLTSTACAAGPAVKVTAAEGNTLDLTLSGLPAGRLVAAVYRGGQMVSAAVQVLTVGATAVTLTFQRELQENDTVKAFLLGQESTAPLIDAVELDLPKAERGKTLVAYFSATNNTKGVAEKIAAHLDADLYEITPAVPYTSADLNYNNNSSRANREQNDPNAWPAIRGDVENWGSYDVVFLGYPIWWGVPPKILHTFVEGRDFSGKTVIPFCTSGSSGYNDSAIKALATGANWITGRRFAGGASASTVQAWVDGLNLPNKEEPVVNKLNVTFNGHSYTATLAENPSVDAFVDYLKSQGGSVTVHAHDYGSFEKVGELGTTLVQTNTQINTVPGDLILYQGANVCLYYATNSWNFTRLGKLEGDLSDLRAHLGSGNVDIVYSLR